MIKNTLLAGAVLCLCATPAFADSQSAGSSPKGPKMLSEQEMDGIVAGELPSDRYLRIGNVIEYFEDDPNQPIYRQIDMPEQGAQKMFAGQGPNNDGVTSFQDYVPDGVPPELPLTIDGTAVGTPSDRGARFITLDITF